METVLIIAIVGALRIVCFFIGAKVGQTAAKGERIETPRETAINAIRAHQAKKEADMKQDRFNTIMRNIEAYDGTANGQQDVPGR